MLHACQSNGLCLYSGVDLFYLQNAWIDHTQRRALVEGLCASCCGECRTYAGVRGLCAGTQKYSTAIDMWSLGCIMAELLTKKVLFDGQSEIQQMQKIWQVLGTPSEENWPGHKQLRNMDKVCASRPQLLALLIKVLLRGVSRDVAKCTRSGCLYFLLRRSCICGISRDVANCRHPPRHAYWAFEPIRI